MFSIKGNASGFVTIRGQKEFMKFEITIEGPPQAIEKISHLLARESFDPVNLSASHSCPAIFKSITLKETDPELLNRKLARIGSLITIVEQQTGLRDQLQIRVRNLGYAEPSCTSEDGPEPFKPVSSLTIHPWTPSYGGDFAPHTIILDPRHAFGTGKHPTTRLCLQILEGMAHGKSTRDTFPSWSVLDFGCGSGLLAMAAIRLGAKKALGVEIDGAAAETAKRNVQHNGLSESVRIRTGSWEQAAGLYDLILANLVPAVLFRTGFNIPSHLKRNGIAVVSGFGESLLQEMAVFFGKAGLAILQRFSLENWGALLMAHPFQNIP